MKKETTARQSWRQMFHVYTTIKIPWIHIILAGLLSIGLKQINLSLVPYQSKIMTGAITGSGFIVGYMGLSFLSLAVEAIQGGINELAAQITSRNTRKVVWKKMLFIPMNYYSKRNAQELVSRITQDTTGVYGALATFVIIISVVYGIIGAFRKMFITYKSLALIMLSGIPLLILGSWIVGKLQYQVITIQNKAIAKMTDFFAERLPNLSYIKGSNMEQEEYERGVKANDDRYRLEIKAEKRFIIMGPIGSFAQVFNQVVLLIVASTLVRVGTMKMYQLVNLYNYYLLFMSDAYMLLAIWQTLKSSQGSVEVIAPLLDESEESLTTGCRLDENVHDITFEHVSFSYDGVTPILKDVSFTIPKRKKTVIVGENGSGKSTIIKLLERFENVNTGTIRVGQYDIQSLNLYQLRDQVGYLYQGNQIMRGTIADNITFGKGQFASEDDIWDVAKRAEADSFIQDKPEGLQSEISQFDNKLSGGEMQRIAIARMLLKQPKYLIMDEATSGIDAISEKKVIGELEKMMEDKTIIMVTHDYDMMKQADHIIVLKDGMVEASGSLQEVLEQSELFRHFAGC